VNSRRVGLTQNSKHSDTVPINTFLNSKHGGNPAVVVAVDFSESSSENRQQQQSKNLNLQQLSFRCLRRRRIWKKKKKKKWEKMLLIKLYKEAML
jgi:hypothetical protein